MFLIAFCYISGTAMLGASAYSGLMLRGIVDPPYESYGGLIGGLLPTALAISSMLLFGQGSKFSRMIENKQPKPMEEFG